MTDIIINDYSATIAKMRAADVTSANAATPWARETFRLLLARNAEGLAEFTYPLAVAAVCAVYVHTTAKGKPGATVGSLKDGGFPAISQRLTTVKRISEQLGVAGVLPLVQAFIASDKAGDSFAKLDCEVKDAVKAAGKAMIAAEDVPAVEEVAKGEGEPNGESQPLSMADKLAAMASIIASLTVEEVTANSEGLAAIMEAIGNAWTLEAEDVATGTDG